MNNLPPIATGILFIMAIAPATAHHCSPGMTR